MTAPAKKVSRIPAHAPRPQDRKPRKAPAKKASAASRARQAEAEDGFVIVEGCGLTLHIPTAGKVPLAAAIAFERGEELLGTELLFGAEQWKAYLDANPTVDDFLAIGKQIEELTELKGN